jgi:methylase of polypeptide subunit release factors
MKINLEVSILKNIEFIKLYLPENVFKPSLMTQELCKSLNLIENIDINYSKILDFGTGPGTIAIALHLIGCRNIYVSDKINSTLEVASKNFQKYKLKPCGVYESDFFVNIPIEKKFDLIITNPPAYPVSELLKLNEGLDISVFSGVDGRFFIERFLREVKEHLSPKGRFIITIPSFLDWKYFSDILQNNNVKYDQRISYFLQLPHYGYNEKVFVENFCSKFCDDFYIDKKVKDKHYRINSKNGAIEYRVKTVIGHF